MTLKLLYTQRQCVADDEWKYNLNEVFLLKCDYSKIFNPVETLVRHLPVIYIRKRIIRMLFKTRSKWNKTNKKISQNSSKNAWIGQKELSFLNTFQMNFELLSFNMKKLSNHFWIRLAHCYILYKQVHVYGIFSMHLL